MYSESRLVEMVKMIYDAAADSSRWPLFLERYQSEIRARNVALGYSTPADGGTRVIVTGADEADMRKYHQYPCPWLDRLVSEHWSTGGADASHHLITDEELERTECFDQFLGPRKFHYGMGAAVAAVGNGPAIFVMLREQPRGPYTEEDLSFLRALLPHMSRALQLYGRIAGLEASRQALADSLDRLATGVLVLDAAGRVLFANRAAQRTLASNDGLRVERTGLSASLTAETAGLRQLIESAAGTTNRRGFHPGGALLVSRPSLRRPLAVSVSPLPQEKLLSGLPGTPAVAVFVNDPEASGETDAALLSRLYHLTPAETRLASTLMEGHDLRQAAERLQVSYHTARAQAKSVFCKTNTHSQSDLLRLLLKMPGRV